jgi:hypothetical protein
VLKFVLVALVAAAAISFVVMRLWNWAMPPIFGLHAIGYWQALALLALARILFGGFRRGFGGVGPGMYWRRRMMERWAQMTPEEREKFRAGIGAAVGGRCGPFAPPASEPKA